MARSTSLPVPEPAAAATMKTSQCSASTSGVSQKR
jgi:hypothetical protein